MKIVSRKRIALLIITTVITIMSGGIGAALINGQPSLDDNPLHQLPLTSGKISYFTSRDVTGYCDGAAWGELLGEDCGNDEATKYWYVAMRWPYVNGASESEILEAKSWWYNKKILVTNPTNDKQVVLAVKSLGPNETTGKVIDVSKTAIEAISAKTGDIVNIEFADQNVELGVYAGEVKTEVFQWPADMKSCKVSLRYDVLLNGKNHTGLDISGSGKQIILASASGKVSKIVRNDVGCASNCGTGGGKCNDHGLGNTVIIEHEMKNGNKVYSMYSHLASIEPDIEERRYVIGGITKIGIMGATGYGQDDYWIKCKKNKNPHLHFEIKDSNTISNPNILSKIAYGYVKGNPDDYGFHNPETYINNNEIQVISYGSGSISSTQWEFNTPNDKEGWELHNIGPFSVTDGIFRIDPNPEDYWIESQPLSVNANNYNAIMINMASNAPDGVGAIYFKTSDSDSYTDDKKVEFTVNADGKFREYSIFMGENPNWKGTITGIRIDPSNEGTPDNKDIGFDFIRLTKISWEFNSPDDKEEWELHNIGPFSVTDGIFRIDPNPGDYWIESQPLAVNANNYNAIMINMASNAPDGVGAIYFKTSDSDSYTDDKKVEFTVNADGKFREYSISMGENLNWKGTITGIRIDPSNDGTSDNKDVGFDYIRFFNNELSLNTPLDIIFVIDTTGSMSDDIDAVKSSASEIVEAIDLKTNNYRVAVVDYRDYPNSPYGEPGLDYLYNLDLSFSNNKDTIVNSINSLSLGHGMDWEESVYSALVKAMIDDNKDLMNADNYGWRNGANKAIILMGDAPAHNPEPWEGGYSLEDVSYWSKNIDPVIVYSIVIGSDSTTHQSFSEISEVTGGKVYTSPSASEIVDTIIKVIGDIGETTNSGVSVSVDPTINVANPEGSVTYSISVTNTGTILDTYDVSIDLQNFSSEYRGYPTAIRIPWINLDPTSIEIEPGATKAASLTFRVPSDWAGMEDVVYPFEVTAKSKTDDSISNTFSAELKVIANKKSMIEYSKLEIIWLSELIKSSSIDDGIKNSLLDKLTNSAMKLDQSISNAESGKNKQANNMLNASQNIINAFINQVEAQYDKKIIQTDAEVLIEKANTILEDIEFAKNV
ncbi:MAG: peptidoglycan DD-metalloendopeptidase family protein [Euryarchaeota archaeon]|nr:peptidoglycan DD-metalloendopeptidase family protein [Euryarchaeota archaeon]